MQRVTHLCLVRHGVTQWNAEGRLQGRTDTELSDLGRRQARVIGPELKKLAETENLSHWDVVYTSPLKRAAHTAQAIADYLKMDITIDPDLVERSFGEMEGLGREQLDDAFPSRHTTSPGIHGLESRSALEARAKEAIERLAALHVGEKVIIVSHGAFISGFLRQIAPAMVGSELTRLDNGSYTWLTVDLESNAWTVRVMNETRHLIENDVHSGSEKGR